jgi:hypothetical protein
MELTESDREIYGKKTKVVETMDILGFVHTNVDSSGTTFAGCGCP